MSIKQKMLRTDCPSTDFNDWEFDDTPDELKPFINKILNNALSTVFSENGADVEITIDGMDVITDSIDIECSLQITEFEAYAVMKVSLEELIKNAVYCVSADEVKNISKILRKIADSIENSASR